ncbi:MAG: hypothetical protein AAF394_17060, partial [Planctomycetota bacterium]
VIQSQRLELAVNDRFRAFFDSTSLEYSREGSLDVTEALIRTAKRLKRRNDSSTGDPITKHANAIEAAALAKALWRMRQFELSAETYAIAFQVEPKTDDLRARRILDLCHCAECYFQTNRWDEQVVVAEKAYHRAVTWKLSDGREIAAAATSFARALYQTRQFDRATEVLEEADVLLDELGCPPIHGERLLIPVRRKLAVQSR